MEQLPVNETLLAKVIQHIVHDKLPIAAIQNYYVAPSGSKEIEGRSTHGTYNDPNYGEFVIVGSKVS